LSRDNSQILSQQRQAATMAAHTIKPGPLSLLLEGLLNEEAYQRPASLNTSHSIPSPIHNDFQTQSPMFRNTSRFSPWPVQDNCLSPALSVLDSVILPYMVKFSEAISYMIWPQPWSYHMRLI
jgi:hypothetical protein